MVGDEPARLFGKEMTEDERNKLLTKAYEHLKSTFQNAIKPDGNENAPARTCRDLFSAYPDKPSGYKLFFKFGAIRDVS